jgi:anthranilate phosphoribosyltransferase
MEPLSDLWTGKITNDYGEAAVIQTAALVVAQHNKVSLEEAVETVTQWWKGRY